MGITREDATELDAQDRLAGLRDHFVIPRGTELYLDGNSLGRPPSRARNLLSEAFERWSNDLILAWRDWIKLPRQIGDDIATEVLQGRPDEVIIGDSTSVSLYKAAAAALDIRAGRRVVVTSDDNFPTDLYVLQSLAQQRGLRLVVLPADPVNGLSRDALAGALDNETALVCLSHVAYRSGALLDLPALTTLAHDAGALTLWDISHSAGSVPVSLESSDADLAVGCTYKYLNGGPGAPSFSYVRQSLQPQLRQPIWGWFGNREQFAMDQRYRPADDIQQMLTGAPTILSTVAIRAGVAAISAAGVDHIYAKAQRLTDLVIELTDEWLTALGFGVASPRDSAHRGAHVSLSHPNAKAIARALIRAGVTVDYRPPDLIRIGPAPLYTRFIDVWDALDRLRRLGESRLKSG